MENSTVTRVFNFDDNTTNINTWGVSLTQMANIATNKVIGRISSGSWVPELLDITWTWSVLMANITSPILDEFIRYNGTQFVNATWGTVSAWAWIQFFYSNASSWISTYETISQTPDSGAEQDESITITNTTSAFEAYSTTVALGRTTINAGLWNFDTYTYCSSILWTNTLTFSIYKRAAGWTETLLFSVTSPDIQNTNVELLTIATVQPAFTILATDLLVVKLSATTDSLVAKTIHFVHSGTTHYSNIKTPLVTLHNDLAWLQWGTANEFNHLTNTEYTNLVTRDVNWNITANNYIDSYATTVTATSSTTLTVSSKMYQFFTGTATQDVVLPDATTLALGHRFHIDNNSTLAVTIKTNGWATLYVLAWWTDCMVVCTDISSAAWVWDNNPMATLMVSWKKLTVNNSLTLSWTDSTTLTFPANGWTIDSWWYRTQATATSTTTLFATDAYFQFFTGTATQDVVLPDATTLTVGRWFYIDNNSTQIVTIKTNGWATLTTVVWGRDCMVKCTDISTAAWVRDLNKYLTDQVNLATEVTWVLPTANGGMSTALYYTLIHAAGSLIATNTAWTFYLCWGTSAVFTCSSGTANAIIPQIINIRAADYPTVNWLAPKLRIRWTVAVNHVAPTGNFTLWLYPLTQPASSWGAWVRSRTIGTVVSWSDWATIATPALDTINNIVGSDFALPGDWWYAICVKTTATVATASYVQIMADLQIHNA